MTKPEIVAAISILSKILENENLDFTLKETIIKKLTNLIETL